MGDSQHVQIDEECLRGLLDLLINKVGRVSQSVSQIIVMECLHLGILLRFAYTIHT